MFILFFFQAEDGIRDIGVTGVQTCALPICVKLSDPNLKPFYGRVKSLYPQAIASENEQSSRHQSSTLPIVPATIQLDRPSGTLIPGSQVSVEIILDERYNVAAVDLTAIQRSRSESFVWIQDERGRAQKRTITLGLEGATMAEVMSGLRPGDRVIMPSPQTLLEPGMPVIPALSSPPKLQ